MAHNDKWTVESLNAALDLFDAADKNPAKIEELLIEIVEGGLNTLRCAITGAPYATISDDDIRLALKAIVASAPLAGADKWLSDWQANLVVMSSRPCPALAIKREVNIAEFARADNRDGYSRIIAMLLTQFYFSKHAMDFLSKSKSTSVLQVEQQRQLFTADAYDVAMTEMEFDQLKSVATQLMTCSSWLPLSSWVVHPIMLNSKDPAGITNKVYDGLVARMRAPTEISLSAKTIEHTAACLMTLRLHSEVKGYAMPATVTRSINEKSQTVSAMGLLLNVAGLNWLPSSVKTSVGGNDQIAAAFAEEQVRLENLRKSQAEAQARLAAARAKNSMFGGSDNSVEKPAPRQSGHKVIYSGQGVVIRTVLKPAVKSPTIRKPRNAKQAALLALASSIKIDY